LDNWVDGVFGVRVDDLIKTCEEPKPEPNHEVCFARIMPPETRRRVDALRAFLVRCFDGGGLGFFLGNTLGDENVVFGFLLLLVVQFTLLKSIQVTTTLETEGCNQSLNLRSFGIGLGVFFFALDLSSNNVFSNIILLAEVEELPDLRRTFRTKSLRKNSVGQRGDLDFTLFDDDEGKDGDIRSDDATANRFTSTLSSATSSIAGLSVGKEGA